MRFFDQFLKGKDTGFSKQPRLAVYVRHSYPPGADRKTIPGEWRYEEGWPIRRSTRDDAAPDARPHARGGGRRRSTPRMRSAYVPSTGEAAGFWWGELTPDQRSADAWSLVYDSGPLPEDIEILGFPKALLRGSADAPLANWFARLSDVAPDGQVTLVTGAGPLGRAAGVRRRSPSPLERGQVYPLRRRDALHVVGLPEGPPRAPGGLQRALADDLADAVRDDDAARARRQRTDRGSCCP